MCIFYSTLARLFRATVNGVYEKKKHFFFENDIMAVATFTNEYRRSVTTPKKKTLCGLHSGHTQYEREAQRERSRTLFLFLNRTTT